MSTRQVSAAKFKAKCLRIIQEMQSDGCSVTITRPGTEWPFCRRCRQSARHRPLLGMLRGSVLTYEDPLTQEASPSDWSALR